MDVQNSVHFICIMVKKSHLSNIFNLSNLELLFNAELVQEIAAKNQGVAWRVDSVDPASGDEECVAGLKLKNLLIFFLMTTLLCTTNIDHYLFLTK